MNESAAAMVIGKQVAQLARQPILDSRGMVVAYSFLAHADRCRESTGIPELFDELVLRGVDRLTAGEPAFVHCPPEAFTREWARVLPHESTVLVLPAEVEVTGELVQAARDFHQAGYRIALADVGADWLPDALVDLSSYIKFSIGRIPAPDQIRRQIEGSRAQLVAECVNTQEDFRRVASEGLGLFQGTFFCHPEVMSVARVPANRIFQAQLLQQLQNPDMDLRKLTPLVRRDPSLVLRLLKLVNSPVCAVRQQVQSIEMAIMMLGERTFRQMMNLALLRELGEGQSPELLHVALVRARFCELAAKEAGLDAAEQYLIGLLSLLPAMMRCSMEKLLADLPLADAPRAALNGEPIRDRGPLSWMEHHERYEVKECSAVADRFGLNEQRLNQFYVDALMWEAATPRLRN